ncbi:MAG: glycosyltransferase family 2 protein [Geminicoccaceae bacterium]
MEPTKLIYARKAQTSSSARDPLVSVLIPTHNRVDLLLSRALPSVLSQTYSNLEIIVAAHGCTDGTAEEVNRLSVKDFDCGLGKRIESGSPYKGFPFRLQCLKILRKETYPPTAENHWLAGPVAPLNAALAVCRGDWIARIDDDDTWTPDHIEKLLRFAQDGNYEFVSSAYRTHEKVIGAEDGIGGTQTWLYRSYLKFMKYNPDCWRKDWHRVNDTDLAERFRKAGVWTGYLDEVTAEVLPRPGETTVGLKAYREDAEAKERALAF